MCHPCLSRLWRLAGVAWLALLLSGCSVLAAAPEITTPTPASATPSLPSTAAAPTAQTAIAATGTPEPSFLPQRGLRIFAAGGTHYLPTTDGATVVWEDTSDSIRAARIADVAPLPPGRP